MGFFEKILGKQIDLGKQMPIYFVSNDEDYMQRAFEQAERALSIFGVSFTGSATGSSLCLIMRW